MLFNVRPLRNGSPVRVIPPFALVVPVPLSVPPDHVIALVTVKLSVPSSVPALWVSELVVIVFPGHEVHRAVADAEWTHAGQLRR